MRVPRSWTVVLAAWLVVGGSMAAAQGRGAAATPPSARAAAVLDLTGQWVSVVTEDWRYRMVTPTRGDYQGVPMTPAAVKVADAWDPAADEATGLQCKSYGAGMIMRVPGRLRISWQDDQTLRVDTDAGSQTRLFRFDLPREAGERSWQGVSAATWVPARTARGRGASAAAAPPGSLKVVTTNLRAAYLRKNGVPYSENANVTEYFSVARLRSGSEIMVVTTVVEDPAYLTQPFIISSQFKKQPDTRGWSPTPCSAQW